MITVLAILALGVVVLGLILLVTKAFFTPRDITPSILDRRRRRQRLERRTHALAERTDSGEDFDQPEEPDNREGSPPHPES